MARIPKLPKSGRRSPATSSSMKQLWQDTEYRNAMIAARRRSAEARAADPHHYSRLGIPNGWRKQEALAALTIAHSRADTMIKEFEQRGIVPEIVIPDSDEEIAKAALREACMIALSPGDKRTRLQAINIVLKFTKAAPVQRHATTLTTTSEEWLQQVLTEINEGRDSVPSKAQP